MERRIFSAEELYNKPTTPADYILALHTKPGHRLLSVSISEGLNLPITYIKPFGFYQNTRKGMYFVITEEDGKFDSIEYPIRHSSFNLRFEALPTT